MLRNASALTLRTALSTLVGLYTSRVVLATLGVSDYGIYGVVGGVVSMTTLLNASMAVATSRFLMFEMGRGDVRRLSLVFSTALLIHAAIALLVIVAGETLGLWFLHTQLHIPEGRLGAATWVFHFSVFASAVGIAQTPFMGAFIAHERMDAYACIDMLSSLLRLAAVFLLVALEADKLVAYAFLLMFVSLLVAGFYRHYCMRHFAECRFRFVLDKPTLRPLLSFSGLDFYGNACSAASLHGVTFLVNIFFGVACNAAASVALTVSGAVYGLTCTIAQALRPQIVKLYAAGQTAHMEATMGKSLRFTLLALSLFAVPCVLEAPRVLELWLGQVPAHSVVFLRIILLSTALNTHIVVGCAAIHATGRIRRLSLLNGTLYLLVPSLTWVAFALGAPVQTTYFISAASNAAIVVGVCALIRVQVPGLSVRHLLKAIVSAWLAVAAASVPALCVWGLMPPSLWRVACVSTAYALAMGLLALFFVFQPSDRTLLYEKARSLCH